jgi:hypothetical protein
MAVSKRTRFEVLRRDNHTCRYCRATDAPLTIDHVTPIALGGTDDPSNLVTACRDCNAGKSSSSPDSSLVADVSDDAARWSAAMKRAAETLSDRSAARDAYVDAVMSEWDRYRNVPARLVGTIGGLHDAGLPLDVAIEAVEAACVNYGVVDRVAYFAGIGWKRVRAMQEIAAQIVAAEEVSCAREV